jgi:S-adenosylmethionine hydrolase
MENPSSSLRRIITLLTDFGSQDYFVGAMKGVILSLNPSAQIVDITHDVPPHDIQAGAFNLLAGYTSFPAGTIHVAVVDPGVGSRRKPLLIECGEQLFVGPDNGIFSWICEREGKFRAILLSNENFFRHPVSATFHGRDIFAPVAAALSKGAAFAEFGPPIDDLVKLESLTVKTRSEGQIEARVIYIDRFGNCVTNLTRDQVSEESFRSGATLSVSGRQISTYRRFFGEAVGGQDDLFCIFGSAGFIEIAAQDSSAAKILDARRELPVVLASDFG